VPDEDQEGLREALKRVAVALHETGRPYVLIGGYAAWARGGPEPDHDVDFMVAREDADAIADALGKAGLKVEQPPEDWLFKVYSDDAMVDVIHRDVGDPATRDGVREGDDLEVLSVEMPVLSATKLLVQKLMAMDEHMCDLAMVLPVARALREQIDWARVRAETSESDFAAAFLFLAERLGLIDPA
jgi:hypothetical protein